MPFSDLKNRIFKSKRIIELSKEIEEKNLINIRGLSYSFKTFIVTYLHEVEKKRVLFLADNVESAEKLRDDLTIILEKPSFELLLPAEVYPYCSSDIDDERKGTRLSALEKIYSDKYEIIISTYRNLFDKYPEKSKFSDLRISLSVGDNISVKELSEKLEDFNFKKENIVESIGEYAMRGNIIDIYPLAAEYPLRIELFDTEIESIRRFDPANQRKVDDKDSVTINFSDVKLDDSTACLTDLLDDNTLVVMEETENISQKLEEYYDSQIVVGYDRLKKEDKKHYSDKYFPISHITESLDKKKVILGKLLDSSVDVRINVKAQGSYSYDFNAFIDSLRNDFNKGYKSFILCDNPGQAERFAELLEEDMFDISALRILVGGLHEGFIYADSKVAVYTDHQIFGRSKRPKNYRRFKKAVPLKELKRLDPGDFIVHMDHGIGQFLGLEKITVAGSVRDVIKIRYKDNDLLYVKLDHIHLIQKYSAAEGMLPVLSKLGGKQFKAVRERTKKSVKNIARELIKIYAQRKNSDGYAFPTDNVWQTEMENSFEFEDTPDQASATYDIKGDMESRMPMDRLVCGDVGFGKTEVAVRAAFKGANGDRQVAVLAPTTILVHQHFQTFKGRLGKYPIKIDYLSRFKNKKEQTEVLQDLKDGKIDIVIGTHRLLSKDIKFNNLGLLIIDEEQRFGVAHKERIKELKVNVDVLTLTATPIPRTLHMSLMGVRDLSLINTPPVNRLPIITEVYPYNEDIIFEAIMKEVDRGGQIYFLHNRVETIDTMKANLERIVPDVKIVVAHGQMEAKKLERIMLEFMHHDFDVLLTTTIIENGVDIPNANTIIINDAHKFGLSQLYQLRGRIGRSHKQGYSYFLVSSMKSLSGDAKKRLDTITEFTDLGSGFQIAMKDLEIRGAGNLLGKEQSGYIENVGFDLYTRILEDAVRELKEEEFSDILVGKEPPKEVYRTSVNLKWKVYLPEDYIFDNAERVELYRRLMDCKNVPQLNEMRHEIKDRFGKEPEEVDYLFKSLYLSLKAGRLFIKSIALTTNKEKEKLFKFVFDMDKLNLVENTEAQLTLQENVPLVRASGDYDMMIEKEGEVVSFFPTIEDRDSYKYVDDILEALLVPVEV